MSRRNPAPQPDQPEELKVFITGREGKCDQCGKEFHRGSWITLVGEAGARCLACADLDELVFLPAGNTALTRRAKAHSALSVAAPRGRETVIAEHACRKYSGRVGRSASAKEFEEPAVRLAVRAHIRHHETKYDELLGQGVARDEARDRVHREIDQIEAPWEGR